MVWLYMLRSRREQLMISSERENTGPQVIVGRPRTAEQFAWVGLRPLYSWFVLPIFFLLGAQFSHAQAHISTEPAQTI